MRFARPLVVALFVLVMAVTPLSAITSGGIFETWLPGYYSATHDRPRYRVVLADETGLVRALSPGQSAKRSPTVFVATWFSCGHSTLRLSRSKTGAVLKNETVEPVCWSWDVRTHSAALHLWAPVEITTVGFDSYE